MRVQGAFVAIAACLVLPLWGGAVAGSVSYDAPASQPEAERLVAKADGDPVGPIEVTANGSVLFADLDGPVWLLEPNASEPRVVFDPPVIRGPEWGITDVVLAPDHESTGDFFVVYMTGPEGTDPTADDVEGVTRVVRVHEGNESLVYGYPATRYHNSGRLLVHDGFLFLTRGDQDVPEQAQDPANPAGNILRMTLDGEPVPDNPLGGYGYAYGFRNPFGIAWDPSRGVLVEAEVGLEKNEEVNLVRPGLNYGWSECEGACAPPNASMEDPIIVYPEIITPTGMAVIGGDYYHGSFNRGEVWRVHETQDGWVSEVVYKHSHLVVDVERSPDGEWLYIGAYDGLWRVPTPTASVEKERDVVPPGSPDRGSDDGNGASRDADAELPPESSVSRVPAPTPGAILALIVIAAAMTRERARAH